MSNFASYSEKNRKSMNRKLMYAFLAIMAMTVLNSCNDEDLEKVFLSP